VFYNAYLELDCANLVSILSFDSLSLKFLLDEKFDDWFSEEFPLFYKNKIQKGESISFRENKTNIANNQYFYRSAIDNALRNNQVLAVGQII